MLSEAKSASGGAIITYHKLTRDYLPYRMKWLNDSEVSRYLGHQVREGVNEAFHRKWFDLYEGDASRKIFVIEADGEVIGQVGLIEIDPYDKNACLYILIGEKNYWNKGIGSQAIEYILDYGFNKLGLHRIWLDVHARNKAAIKLYQKYGFVKEGVFKDNVLYKDGYDDEIRMAKIGKEAR